MRVKQLICGSLNGMRLKTDLATAIHTLDKNAGPLEGTGAGSWSLGSGHRGWEPRMRAAVDCGEMDPGEVREEIVMKMPVEESRAAT